MGKLRRRFEKWLGTCHVKIDAAGYAALAVLLVVATLSLVNFVELVYKAVTA